MTATAMSDSTGTLDGMEDTSVEDEDTDEPAVVTLAPLVGRDGLLA